MNKLYFILILFTGLSCATAAQEAPKKEPVIQRQTITKGYYSIGDHASKLPRPAVLYSTRTVKEPAQKGYYSIAPTERSVIVIDLPPGRQRITKGYYSIDSKRDSSERRD